MDGIWREKFLNFSVGPVEMDSDILNLGSIQLPYFRTEEFSNLNLENENLIKSIVNAEDNSRALFLTSSGTGAMEATIMNSFNINDKVLIVNGGSFGQRFVEICKIHSIPYDVIELEYGTILEDRHLEKFKDKGFTGFIVNIHETSTGVLYNIDLISEFCQNQNLILVVDAISSFLADNYDMKKYNIDVTILSSQKALALPPGISIIILNSKMVSKVMDNKISTLYFDLKKYLIDGERGQTPFTPAVGIIIQLNKRLNEINKNGVEYYTRKTKIIADDFRNRIVEMPFKISRHNISNALTPIEPIGKMKANEIFEYVKNKYNIFLCPNGGALKEKLIRVGHIGNITLEHNDILINVFKEMEEGGLL